MLREWHVGVEVCTVASRLERPGFESGQVPFCVEFCLHVLFMSASVFLWVLWLPHTIQRHAVMLTGKEILFT